MSAAMAAGMSKCGSKSICSGGGEARLEVAERERRFGRNGARLDARPLRGELVEGGDVARVEEDRGRHLLAPGCKVHVAEVELRDGNSGIVQRDGVAYLPQEHQRPRRL